MIDKVDDIMDFYGFSIGKSQLSAMDFGYEWFEISYNRKKEDEVSNNKKEYTGSLENDLNVSYVNEIEEYINSPIGRKRLGWQKGR